jgi:hypothetical protein
MKVFIKENFKELRINCEDIIYLCKEAEKDNGDLMFSQLRWFGELIEKFVENPIIKNSGIIKNEEEK